ncbi:SNAP and CHAT domain-containing protein [Ktedonobacteria bacterium brp13]|nr:SNAP and CHAT domain-containing protein [Ktedonobacteria bacterium brp13]
MGEAQGQQLLRACLPQFSATALNRLVDALKREADQNWYVSVERSLLFSGYLLLIGDLTRNMSYHALGLMARGDALRRMNRNQEALPFFDAAGEEFLAINDEVGWARTRFGRMGACLRLNRTSEALRDAEAARDVFMHYKKWRRVGQIDVNAAIINYEVGHYEEALHHFDRAIETYGLCEEPMELYIARAQGNKALALAAQGKFREALLLHEQVRAAFARAGDSEVISVAREDMNIADIYEAQGHYSAALLLYDQCRAIFKRCAMPDAAYMAALKMCSCLVRLNRTREAYELADETVIFFRATPGQPEVLAHALMHKAAAAIQLGKVHDSAVMLYEASRLLEGVGYQRLAALARFQRAELYFSLHLLDASAREAEYVADAFAEHEDLPRLAHVMLLQGYIANERGESATAQDLCMQALDIASGQEMLDLLYRCNDFLGQLAERRGDLARAATFYERAIQGIDEIQSRLVLDERSSFLENKADIYQRAILLAWRRGFHELAFTFVEKAKSRVLSDYLRHNIDIRIRYHDSDSAEVVEALHKAREEQAYFSSIVHQTEDEVHLSDSAKMRVHAVAPEMARQEMQKRERQVEQLLERVYLRSAGNRHVHSRFNWMSNTADVLKRSLAPATVLLEYYIAGEDLYIFQMTNRGIAMQLVAGAVPRLERLMSLWRTNLDLIGGIANTEQQEQISASLLGNGLGLLQRLYDLLLRPVVATLHACEHLLIVPYGLLHYLPFHSLYDGEHFLVEYVEVSYLPAASLLDICQQRGERVGQAIRQQALQVADSLVMGLSDGGRLAYAVHEAEVVAAQLDVYCYRDKEATSRLLAGLQGIPTPLVPNNPGDDPAVTPTSHDVMSGGRPGSPLIHIAAHGLFRLDAPNFSYIKLADRQFSTIEAFNLDLTACSLLVLSACETGRGVIGGLDEVIGLGRGFLYAGAASLLPTLWKVDDASSAELMETFYHSLLSGATKAAALAQAQRTFIAHARETRHTFYLHPYFWAAFHLIGDPGPLV